MGTNQDYKNRALASLEGKWSNGVIATLIVVVIAGLAGNLLDMAVNGASGLWTLLCLPLSWGGTVYFLNLIRNEDISYSRLFDGYKDYGRIFGAEFLGGVIVLLGLVLLIVPGIILALMLSQVAFILKDDREIGVIDAMKESVRMMKGHKMELFWLELSFIGWILLCGLTLGIGVLFLAPYMYSALAHYYEDLKKEQATI